MANFWFGGIDHRYLDSNAYILASEGALAIVVGPLMLLYAWSTFVRAPFRHIVGVITTTAQVYSAVIYYGIEIRSNFRDISGRGPGIMAIAIIFDLLVSVILPIRILWSESAVLSRICSKAYSNDASKLVRKTNRKPSSATLIRSKSFMSAIPEETERLSNSKSSLRSTYSQRASPVDAALLRRRAPSGSSSPFEKSPSLRGAKFDMIGRLSSGDQTQDVDGPRSSLNTANTSRHEDDFEDFTMTI